MARIYLPTSQQMDVMIEKMGMIANAVSGRVDLSSWEDIQRAVRMGVGPRVLPVGTQLTVNHSVYGDLVFDVVAHNYLKHYKDNSVPTMTLLMHDQLSAPMLFDSAEAFYYAEEALPAGTYNFTLSTTYSAWAAGTYQFTLTQSLPEGGQLVIKNNAETSMTANKVKAYASARTIIATEEADITVGNGGTSLGTFGVELNNTPRASYGSNNYKESSIRQFVLSEEDAGYVWTPQTKYDRPPAWVDTTAGFLRGLDEDFKAVVGTVSLPCCTNSTYESPDSTTTVGQAYILHDKFYLASRKEIYGTSDDVDDGSAVFPYYDGATNVDRIKLRNGTAVNWWLRTPARYTAHSTRASTNGGNLSNSSVLFNQGLVIACTIM